MANRMDPFVVIPNSPDEAAILVQGYSDSPTFDDPILGDQPLEAITLRPAVGRQDGTARLGIGTYEETDSPGRSECIRLFSLGPSAKTAIAFFPEPTDLLSHVWVQAHKYLHNYGPANFNPANVNVGADTINMQGPSGVGYAGYTSGIGGRFTSTGVLPAPLVAGTLYYINYAAGIAGIFTDAGRTLPVDLTDQGSGSHTFTPDLTTFNNLHKHFSIEVSDSGGAKQTRLSIPYGFDVTEIGIFSSNFNVNDGALRVNGSVGSNRNLQFGNTLSDNLVPDGTQVRWDIRCDSTAEGGSNAGSDFRIVRRTDAGVVIDQPIFIKRSSGSVGILTTSPTAQLEIGNNAATTSQIRLNRAANTNTAGFLVTTNATDKWFIGLRNSSSDELHFRDSQNGKNAIVITQGAVAPNITLGISTPSYGGGVGVLMISNASTTPTTNPTGGGLLYVSAGALRYRGSAGTDVQLAAA